MKWENDTFALVQRMRPNEVQIFSLYNAWEQLFLLTLALPLFQSLYNLYVKDYDKNKIISAVIGLNVTLCAIWLVVYIIFREAIVSWLGLSEPICDLLFIQLLFQPIITNWLVHQSFFYKYKRMTVISITSSVLSVVLSLAFVLSVDSHKVEAKVLAGVMVLGMIAIMLLADVLRNDRHFYNKDMEVFDNLLYSLVATFCVGVCVEYF